MISKNTIKQINSLRTKKFRNELGLFIAEGEKLVNDLLQSSICIKTIYHTSKWVGKESNIEKVEISDVDMKKISGLTTPSTVLALAIIPDNKINTNVFDNSLSLALDGIQDPGNLGTIIRLANWFGINNIICSNDTADAYSPKVIQACMGAITGVSIIYCDLGEILKKVRVPVYGTFMEGENIYTSNLPKNGIIVMGNEGSGIRSDVEKLISKKIHIPNFGSNRDTVESLNVAMATAIVCSEFRRRG